MRSVNALNWINTDKYPLDNPGAESLRIVVNDVRSQLRSNGCAVLKNFIRPEALGAMASEAAMLAPRAFFTHAEATVYGGEPDESFPEGHPRRHILKRENGFVAGDFIDLSTGIRQIYHSPELKAFLAGCLGVDEIHEFGDPLAQ
ncbi:hypothetical protein, partial [uncultured Caballeronia sp.]|uniref:hypothetical protein n=1 Tax=uncultured Caballeronia sp. TaxID=1827198 RepID=UPI0035CB29B7